MEGGIGIALLLIIAVVGAGFAITLYLTGGGLWAKETSRKGEGGDAERPEHKAPTTPAQEHTEFVGTERDD